MLMLNAPITPDNLHFTRHCTLFRFSNDTNSNFVGFTSTICRESLSLDKKLHVSPTVPFTQLKIEKSKYVVILVTETFK